MNDTLSVGVCAEPEGTTKLKFDTKGKIDINLDDLVNLELVRRGGLLLKSRGHSKIHFADYQLRNSGGTINGRFFSYAHALNAIYCPEMFFEIMPGSNELEITVYQFESPNDKKRFLYEFQVDGRIYKNGGPLFIMEDYAKNYTDKFLDRMSQLVLLLEGNVGSPKRVSRVKLTTNKFGFSHDYNGDIEIAHSELANVGVCNKRFVERTLIHEVAHNFYDQINENDQLGLLQEFKDFVNNNVANGNFGKKRFLGRFAGESSWTYDEGCVMAVFMERYYKGESPNAGHPWDNLSEVFASTTAIMRCHADELFSKIEKLPTEQDKTLAMETMSKIVGLYQKYCRTGTALFPRKILTYMI